ncbi:GDSL-type esterase/lipase family protein [Sphaerisporangium corydalis]|uniref:GDSL-type esterase/lipase family protein n=1 Tax=Sphaerisporangium corydalis TaxID=1441875 RepID=A0ABV9EE36_9ACTN|nr:GDSL-type esterase/lipase family protein [Sphaerisporangium corydalis]
MSGAAPGTTPTIMIVGDSISQGREGDHTWRYRFWRTLDQRRIPARFAGPWAGTWVSSAVQPGPRPAHPDDPVHAGRYRDGIDFPACRHYASWGRLLREAKDNIRGAVAAYEADHLLVALGFNDLAWGVSGPGRLAADAETFVRRAREANPDVQLLIANVVHRTPLRDQPGLARDITAYNLELSSLVAALSTERSAAVLVDLDGVYDPYRDSYDGVHPNGSGEIRIARAFAGVYASAFGHDRAGVPDPIPAPAPALG